MFLLDTSYKLLYFYWIVFRLKLHSKSCEVEKEIEENRRIVDELQNLLRFETEELLDIFSEATIFKDRLIHQKYEETQNRLAQKHLFTSNYETIWTDLRT